MLRKLELQALLEVKTHRHFAACHQVRWLCVDVPCILSQAAKLEARPTATCHCLVTEQIHRREVLLRSLIEVRRLPSSEARSPSNWHNDGEAWPELNEGCCPGTSTEWFRKAEQESSSRQRSNKSSNQKGRRAVSDTFSVKMWLAENVDNAGSGQRQRRTEVLEGS